MTRGTNLVRMLDLLRAECRLSLNPAHNSQVRDIHLSALQRTQDWLWEDFNWPHLRVERNFAVQAGQRFYTPPSDISIDRIQDVWFRYGNRWTRLTPFITIDNYRQWDSETDMRSWPVSRWRIYEDETMELWPVPASDGTAADLEGYVKVVGIRKLQPFVYDGDNADLDDRLIVLYAAAEILAANGAKDAQVKMDQANKRYAKLRGHLMPRRKMQLGGADEFNTKSLLRGPPRVQYRTTN